MARLFHIELELAASNVMSFTLLLPLLINFSQLQAFPQISPEDYLAPHNAARANVNVEPMLWDDNVAAYASEYANQRAWDCNLVHSTGGPYGENLAKNDFEDLSVGDAINMWVSEMRNYDYESNSCQGGQCLHYTQVVWADSVRLGCASVTCGSGGTFVICSYDPQGNCVGEHPY